MHYALITAFLLLVTACSELPKDEVRVNSVPPIFPDYIGVTIPDGIAPLNFNMRGTEIEAVDVVVKGSKGGELHSNDEWAHFDIDEWHELTKQNRGGTLTFSVCAKTNGRWLRYDDFKMYVSKYPLDEWGLTYRRIAPGYEVYSEMGLYQRNLSNYDEEAFIKNTMITGQCLNCHTQNKTNPKQFVFHVRGSHGATMIQQDGKREWLKPKNDDIGGSLVYPYWHPSGKYCAFSTNQTRQGFHVVKDERIEVFDLSSDVLVYNPSTHEIIRDSLLSQKEWSENSPVFSPDGKTLYFTTCLQQEYPKHFKEQRYNLCKISFDPDKGTFGNKVDTLFNAVKIGKSVSWPKPSYDGKYIMFTLSNYGYFSIWHKESDQWLLDLTTGEVKPLTAANSNDADSYHNWNINSHWFVFTSRRGDGLHSNLYLSSIDEQGRATKPFLLPQENPWEYYDETRLSFNVPDFTSEKVEFDSRAAGSEIESDKRVNTRVKSEK